MSNISISDVVGDIMRSSLYNERRPGTIPPDAVVVESVISTFVFHPERLVLFRDKIKEILKQAPASFHVGTGGGSSFLQLVTHLNKDNRSDQSAANMLVAVAIGLDMALLTPTKDMWSVMPGCVPYVSFNVDGFEP